MASGRSLGSRFSAKNARLSPESRQNNMNDIENLTLCLGSSPLRQNAFSMRLLFEPRTAFASAFSERPFSPAPSKFPDCELEADRHQQPEPQKENISFQQS
jgi:hypothetical protein